MIVCLCRGIPERTIRAAIADGAASVTEVRRACGAGGDCGACHPMVAELVDEAGCLAARMADPSPSSCIAV
jgi:bacterioferritin-associated ferredoxin